MRSPSFLTSHGRSLLAGGAAADVVALDAALETAADGATTPRADIDDLVGEALIVSGDLDGARRRLERSAGDGPLPSRRAWLLGRIHWERGALAEARDVFARAQDRWQRSSRRPRPVVPRQRALGARRRRRMPRGHRAGCRDGEGERRRAGHRSGAQPARGPDHPGRSARRDRTLSAGDRCGANQWRRVPADPSLDERRHRPRGAGPIRGGARPSGRGRQAGRAGRLAGSGRDVAAGPRVHPVPARTRRRGDGRPRGGPGDPGAHRIGPRFVGPS